MPRKLSPPGQQSEITLNAGRSCTQRLSETFLGSMKGPDMIMMKTIGITKINIKWGQWVQCAHFTISLKKERAAHLKINVNSEADSHSLMNQNFMG